MDCTADHGLLIATFPCASPASLKPPSLPRPLVINDELFKTIHEFRDRAILAIAWRRGATPVDAIDLDVLGKAEHRLAPVDRQLAARRDRRSVTRSGRPG
jgi:hypothetical protein